jgi:hypothetical protein
MGDITSLLAKLDYRQLMLKSPDANALTYLQFKAICEVTCG